MKFQYRIVIPFTLLFIVTTFITAIATIRLMSRTVENRLEAQMSDASRMIARSEFAMNSMILENLKGILHMDVITYVRGGQTLASTLKLPADGDLLQIVQSSEASQHIQNGGEEWMIFNTERNGVPYKIGYRSAPARPGTVVAVAASGADIAATQRTIVQTVLVLTLIMATIMVVVGHAVAKGVTRPVLQLVEFTKLVSAGYLMQSTEIHDNSEIGRLASAFDEMVEQLRRSKEKLVQSEKLALAGVFAARVAHDVRNPLSAIRMQAQVLRMKFRPATETGNLLQEIIREVDRVEWVIQDLLELATPQELRLETTRVEDVLDETLQQSELQLRHRKIEVRKEYDDSTPSLQLDRRRFQLALMNLIFNAAEAMPNGGNLWVRTHNEPQSSGITVEIIDNGGGIPPEIRDRLFQPFVTTKVEGIGLGLVNTRNIIEKHGGTIDLMSEQPRGTQAVIRLPVKDKGKGELLHG